MSKINSKLAISTSAVALIVPALAFADDKQFKDLAGTMQSLLRVLNIVIVVGFALAFVALVWGVAKYIFSAGDEESKAKGVRIMVGGVIGLFVITAVWGLVVFLQNSLGIKNETPTAPHLSIPDAPIESAF